MSNTRDLPAQASGQGARGDGVQLPHARTAASRESALRPDPLGLVYLSARCPAVRSQCTTAPLDVGVLEQLSVVSAHGSGAQLTAPPLAIRATLAAVGGPAVTQRARAEAAAFPQPRPVAVPSPQLGGLLEGVGKVAHTIGVVVHFCAADVTPGDADTKRDVGVGTRHCRPPRAAEPRPAAPRRRTDRGYRFSPSRGRVFMGTIIAPLTDEGGTHKSPRVDQRSLPARLSAFSHSGRGTCDTKLRRR
jgi:hypothetical protein